MNLCMLISYIISSYGLLLAGLRLKFFRIKYQVLQTEGALTVDLMRYLVSYAQGLLNINDNSEGRELIETSIRNLLTELVNAHGVAQISNVESTSQIRPLSQGQFSRPPRQNIEMKRGDWICPK